MRTRATRRTSPTIWRDVVEVCIDRTPPVTSDSFEIGTASLTSPKIRALDANFHAQFLSGTWVYRPSPGTLYRGILQASTTSAEILGATNTLTTLADLYHCISSQGGEDGPLATTSSVNVFYCAHAHGVCAISVHWYRTGWCLNSCAATDAYYWDADTHIFFTRVREQTVSHVR